MELYLNQIYLGVGAYGVAAASLEYFDKSVNDLGYEEAALLAALPKAPSKYNPFKSIERAKARRNIVLKNLYDNSYINNNEYEELKRKIKEAILAFRIERAYSKERIMELYLNQIYLGEGTYGIAAATPYAPTPKYI